MESSSFFEDEDEDAALAAGLDAERDPDAFAAVVADAALRDLEPAVVLRLVASVPLAVAFAVVLAVVFTAAGAGALAVFRVEAVFEVDRGAVLAAVLAAPVFRDRLTLLVFDRLVLLGFDWLFFERSTVVLAADVRLDAVFLRVVLLAGICSRASSTASAFSSAALAFTLAAFANALAASAVASASLAVAAISALISMDLSWGAVESAFGGSIVVAVSSVCFAAAWAELRFRVLLGVPLGVPVFERAAGIGFLRTVEVRFLTVRACPLTFPEQAKEIYRFPT